MTAQQVFPASLPPQYAQEVRQQWERFVSGQLLDVETVRPVVRDSWLRCQATGLDPFHPPLAPAVSEEELESLRAGDPLYRHGAAVLGSITDTFLLPKYSLLVIANARSQAVHITGDPHAVATVAEANIVPGSHVGESAIGTKVLSLSSHTGQPAVTYRAEHYVASLQAWQSCALPLWYPQTDRLAGVISLCSLAQYEWQWAFHFLASTCSPFPFLPCGSGRKIFRSSSNVFSRVWRGRSSSRRRRWSCC